MGQVIQAGAGQAPARQAALLGGLPVTTSATTINKVCGSGLKAIMLGAAEIRAGDADVVVAGGMESMNGAPYLLPRARFGYRLGDGTLVDATVHDALWCAIEECHVGTHAERVAISNQVSREDQDAFALRSHQNAIAAMDGGRFDAELAPVTVRDAKGRETVVTVDEGPRRDSTIEALARLKPVFDLPEGEDRGDATSGTATAGNVPGITDGAAATVVVSERTVERYGLKPLARIVGYAQADIEPKWLFLAPVMGVRRLLDRIEMPIEAFDLDRDQRGVRRPGPRRRPGARLRLGQGQRQRRRDRPWPPGRGVGSPDRRDAAPRARSGARAATASRPCASAAAARWRWPSSASEAGDGSDRVRDRADEGGRHGRGETCACRGCRILDDERRDHAEHPVHAPRRAGGCGSGRPRRPARRSR